VANDGAITDWFPAKIEQIVKKQTEKRMDLVLKFLVTYMRRLLSVRNEPRVRGGSKKKTKKSKKSLQQAAKTEGVNPKEKKKAVAVGPKVKKLKNVGRMRGLNPSAEGEAPKLVEGTLRSNVDSAVQTSTGSVTGYLGVRKGPASFYALRLEKGFKGTDKLGRKYNQGPRPYIWRTVKENSARIMRLFGGKVGF